HPGRAARRGSVRGWLFCGSRRQLRRQPAVTESRAGRTPHRSARAGVRERVVRSLRAAWSYDHISHEPASGEPAVTADSRARINESPVTLTGSTFLNGAGVLRLRSHAFRASYGEARRSLGEGGTPARFFADAFSRVAAPREHAWPQALLRS